MKQRIILIIGILCVLAIVIAGILFSQEYQSYRNYTNNMLNRSVYGTCDNMIEMNALLEKIVHQGYVLETELLILDDMYEV